MTSGNEVLRGRVRRVGQTWLLSLFFALAGSCSVIVVMNLVLAEKVPREIAGLTWWIALGIPIFTTVGWWRLRASRLTLSVYEDRNQKHTLLLLGKSPMELTLPFEMRYGHEEVVIYRRPFFFAFRMRMLLLSFYPKQRCVLQIRQLQGLNSPVPDGWRTPLPQAPPDTIPNDNPTPVYDAVSDGLLARLVRFFEPAVPPQGRCLVGLALLRTTAAECTGSCACRVNP